MTYHKQQQHSVTVRHNRKRPVTFEFLDEIQMETRFGVLNFSIWLN